MRYDFLKEYYSLWQSPKTVKEAYNKLTCLAELAERRNGVDLFRVAKLSKRRARLLKTYWAFRRTEARA